MTERWSQSLLSRTMALTFDTSRNLAVAIRTRLGLEYTTKTKVPATNGRRLTSFKCAREPVQNRLAGRNSISNWSGDATSERDGDYHGICFINRACRDYQRPSRCLQNISNETEFDMTEMAVLYPRRTCTVLPLKITYRKSRVFCRIERWRKEEPPCPDGMSTRIRMRRHS